MSLRRLALCAWLATLAFASAAPAATIWNEGVDGDLSNNRALPTLLSLSLGTNTIIGSVIAGERDYFRFAVPGSTGMSELRLAAYNTGDLGFLAIQSGTQITVDPALPTPAPLLGYVHTSLGQVGTDILDDMALGGGAIGFTPPLGPGDYSFWMQQLSGTLTQYTFDVVVVPEPASAALLALGLAGLALSGRQRA